VVAALALIVGKRRKTIAACRKGRLSQENKRLAGWPVCH